MTPADWLMFGVAFLLGMFAGLAFVTAPLLVYAAGKDESDTGPGLRGAMLIWLVLTLVGLLMAVASVWIGSRLPAEAWG